MALAFMGLLGGLLAGLRRIGWSLPLTPGAVHHGALMIGGFLCTLISLEKTIPLKRKILFIIPVLNALTLLIIVPGWYYAGVGCMIAGAAGIILLFSFYFLSQPNDPSNQVMLAGSVLLLIGNILFAVHRFYPVAVMWWIGFVLFVITGERLELSKFLPVSTNSKRLLLMFLFLFPLGLVLPQHGIGKYFSGVALVGISIWLLKHDVIRIGLWKEGLVKFSAMALLLGNIALLLDGILLVLSGEQVYTYDSFVHTFFIGYVMTMIFAHGPIILPGVLGISIKPYHPLLYLWLFLLFVSLCLRLFANVILDTELRKLGGLLSALCIVLYFLTMLTQLIRLRHAKVV
jgi:hypothetical protein